LQSTTMTDGQEYVSGWDGRASIVPSIVNEKDDEFVEKYREYCERERLPNVLDGEEDSGGADADEDNDDDDDGSDASSSSGDNDGRGYLPREVCDNPPMYDKNDLFHPLHERDFQMLPFVSIELMGFRIADTISRSTSSTWGILNQIREDSMSIVYRNRKTNRSVGNALRSVLTLKARLTGLGPDAPIRVIRVPGSTPLSAFHDRVLCPVFGWTRGYHDYRFSIPPSAYQQGPPKIAMLDLVFGPERSGMSLLPQHGFYGTLRTRENLASIPDTKVCIADLLQCPGHELWHVLGSSGSGWKTAITIEDISSIEQRGSSMLHPDFERKMPERTGDVDPELRFLGRMYWATSLRSCMRNAAISLRF